MKKNTNKLMHVVNIRIIIYTNCYKKCTILYNSLPIIVQFTEHFTKTLNINYLFFSATSLFLAGWCTTTLQRNTCRKYFPDDGLEEVEQFRCTCTINPHNVPIFFLSVFVKDWVHATNFRDMNELKWTNHWGYVRNNGWDDPQHFAWIWIQPRLSHVQFLECVKINCLKYACK